MIGHEIDMFELLIYRNTFCLSIEYSFISLISLACVFFLWIIFVVFVFFHKTVELNPKTRQIYET